MTACSHQKRTNIAQEITDDLEAAREQSATIAEDLNN